FFLSSRRRHTRFSRDWSSDVCSSDLRGRRRLHRGAAMENDVVRQEQLKSLKTLTMVVYALQGLSFVTGGVTGVVGVIINYIKREQVAGTLLESHFRWQIRTFWFALDRKSVVPESGS